MTHRPRPTPGRRPAAAVLGLSLLLLPAAAAAEPFGAKCDDTDDPERELCRDREIYFMPGIQGVLFLPNGDGESAYWGAGVQIAPFSWTHNNDRFGPGQGAVFAQVSLLRSASSNAAMGLFEIGTTLSLERNSSRRWLIPFFGLSMGGLVHAELPDVAFTHAFAGLHVYWHHNVVIDLSGGYSFPFSELDVLSGPRAQATVRFSMW